MTSDTRAYLAARLDQLAAADRHGDTDAQTTALAQLIADDRPDARRAIADALLLLAARDTTRPHMTTASSAPTMRPVPHDVHTQHSHQPRSRSMKDGARVRVHGPDEAGRVGTVEYSVDGVATVAFPGQTDTERHPVDMLEVLTDDDPSDDQDSA